MEAESPEIQSGLVDLLEEHSIVFSVSQLPEIRRQKAVALKEINSKLRLRGVNMTENQLHKKILNMKCRVKMKLDFTKTGKRRPDLKDWEKKLLVIMQANTQRTIRRILGGQLVAMDSLVEDLLRELECPICMEYQVPPILQCTNGHNICNSCKPSLQNCPSCRGGFMDVRCKLMENLSNRITHPCKYKISGCTGHFLMDFKKQHENECLYSPHKCPFVISSACTWVGALVQIKEHIISSHCLKNLDGQMYFVSKQNGITRDAIYIFDEVFFFYAKSLGNLVQMMITFVGFEEEAKRYKYKITIQTPDGVQSMSVCLTCSSYIRFTENQPTFTDDVCAIFPSTFFCNLINKESRVPFNLEIFKSPPKE